MAHLIDCRVVDDLIGDIQLLAWVCSACFVSHLYCSLDTPAVAIRLCKLDSQAFVLPGIATFAHLCYKAGCRVPDSVILHQGQAVFVIDWIANVSPGLAKATPKGSAIKAYFLRHAFRYAVCFAGGLVQQSVRRSSLLGFCASSKCFECAAFHKSTLINNKKRLS